MSRRVVTGLFLLFTIATTVSTWHALARAVDHPTLALWALAVNAVLRLAVVGAFTLFVAIRRPSARPSREPRCSPRPAYL